MKIRDRVIFIKDHAGESLIGETGVITRFCKDQRVQVLLDSGERLIVNIHIIQPIQHSKRAERVGGKTGRPERENKMREEDYTIQINDIVMGVRQGAFAGKIGKAVERLHVGLIKVVMKDGRIGYFWDEELVVLEAKNE